MAEATDDLVTRYFARFGAAGDFERWLLPPDLPGQLMAEALRRGRPVTLNDVKRAYEASEGEPYPGPPPPGSLT